MTTIQGGKRQGCLIRLKRRRPAMHSLLSPSPMSGLRWDTRPSVPLSVPSQKTPSARACRKLGMRSTPKYLEKKAERRCCARPSSSDSRADTRSVSASTAPTSAPQRAGSIGVRCSRAGSHAACAARERESASSPRALHACGCTHEACNAHGSVQAEHLCSQVAQHRILS